MTSRLTLACAILACAVATPAFARPRPVAIPIDVGQPEKMSTLIVFGNDPCPQSSGDEIVVCARQPESERYRLPKQFRGKKRDAGGDSWGDRVSSLEYVGRAGTPNSCSPVGSGGQTGCYTQFLQQSRAERRQADTAP